MAKKRRGIPPAKEIASNRFVCAFKRFNDFCKKWRKSVVLASLITLGTIFIWVANILKASKEYGFIGNNTNSNNLHYKSNEAAASTTDSLIDSYTPKWFSRNDIRIVNTAIYQLFEEGTQSLSIGNCPDIPCFFFDYYSKNVTSIHPILSMSFGGAWNGIRLEGESPWLMDVEIRKGCGFHMVVPRNDIYFEVVDDRVGKARAEIVIMKNENNAEGKVGIIESGCK